MLRHPWQFWTRVHYGWVITSAALVIGITAYGWRRAYAVAGILAGALMTLSALVMWRDPQSKNGGLPYGVDERDTQHPLGNTDAEPGISLKEALRTTTFWWMCLAFGFWWFGGSIIYVQLAPFVLEKGFDVGTATLALICFGAGNGIGKIVMGLLADRVGGGSAFRCTTGLAILTMIALVPSRHPLLLLGLSIVFGIGFGGATPQLTTITLEHSRTLWAESGRLPHGRRYGADGHHRSRWSSAGWLDVRPHRQLRPRLPHWCGCSAGRYRMHVAATPACA